MNETIDKKPLRRTVIQPSIIGSESTSRNYGLSGAFLDPGTERSAAPLPPDISGGDLVILQPLLTTAIFTVVLGF